MQPTTPAFKDNARAAIADPALQDALDLLKAGFQARRADAVAALPEFDALRDAAVDIKNDVIAHLDHYLIQFEASATENGCQVHWAEDGAEARQIIHRICRDADAKVVTKSKSMIAEEIGLNDFLDESGLDVVETDLGEYIVQLAEEPPSHIIVPAIHKSKEEIADLFLDHHAKHGKTERLTEAPDMVAEAREVLRDRYFEAEVGLSGANMLVAETGSVVLVTNEGNADLIVGLPRVHIVLASLEKVVPRFDDAGLVLRLLARSATGQAASTYTSIINGPRRDGDLDGPEAVHIVLLDNGRSELVGSDKQEVLRCIRCGACMNHCPVYAAVGGHAYGWVYPGPIGAALTPALIGVEAGGHLPNASSFCGRCEAVCPMRIPLPKIMRHWRAQEFRDKLNPARHRWGLGLWSWFARRPSAYRRATGLAMRALRVMARGRGRLARLPLAGAWTGGRDFPAPEGATFQARWARGERR